MKIFKLQPYADKLDSEHWQASTYKGPVTIRAASEDDAHHIANCTFGIAVERKGFAQTTPVLPWGKIVGLVDCVELNNSPYSIEGKEEILDPADFNEEWLRAKV